MLPWKKLSIVPLILYIRFYTSTCVPRYHMTLRERRRGFDPRLTSSRLGSSTVSGAAGSSSTCRFGAPFVRRYISRRRVEATADPRHTVALSPPRVALRHFRTSCEKPPERTNGGGVASPSLGTVVPIRPLSPSTSSLSPSLVVDDNRNTLLWKRCVRLRGRDTTRDVPGKREAISSLRASSNISTVPPRLSRARFTLTCRGAREEQGARPRVISSYDETSIPFSSLSLYEHHEEEQRQSARDVVRTR